ncbi:MAG: RNA polymerase sigma factor RpoD/SigA [Treponema sp.]|jgi:RNA polymerase primary sigma factor|nr:RNA polymerase sigma factor RpoD/SigA [Treponema sp.]
MKNKTDTDDTLHIYVEQIKVHALLSFDEELELARLIQQGNQRALDKLIKANLRLAIKIARTYTVPDVPLMDLIQEGNIGLIYAAKKYDHEKKVRFCTYASWWIRQFINRYLTNKRRIVRLPHRKEEMLRKIQHTYNTLSQTLMHQPRTEDIADELGISVQVINNIINMSSGPISLESTTSTDDVSVIEIYEDYTYSPERHLFRQYYREGAQHSLDRLKDRERQVLAYRYQLNGDEPRNLKEIGERMNLSPETVRQIEIRALAKIRSSVHEHDYLGYQEAI